MPTMCQALATTRDRTKRKSYHSLCPLSLSPRVENSYKSNKLPVLVNVSLLRVTKSYFSLYLNYSTFNLECVTMAASLTGTH